MSLKGLNILPPNQISFKNSYWASVTFINLSNGLVIPLKDKLICESMNI